MFGTTASLKILGFVGNAIKEKQLSLSKKESDQDEKDDGRKDFLTRFVELQRGNPSIPHW